MVLMEASANALRPIGLGGTPWALYRQALTAGIGSEVIALVFIVIIIGGLAPSAAASWGPSSSPRWPTTQLTSRPRGVGLKHSSDGDHLDVAPAGPRCGGGTMRSRRQEGALRAPRSSSVRGAVGLRACPGRNRAAQLGAMPHACTGHRAAHNSVGKARASPGERRTTFAPRREHGESGAK
jgi:hypothetical protein